MSSFIYTSSIELVFCLIGQDYTIDYQMKHNRWDNLVWRYRDMLLNFQLIGEDKHEQ